MQNFAATTCSVVILATQVWASEEAKLDELLQAIQLDDTIEIMHVEGQRYGGQLGAEMLPGVNAARWDAIVAQIYDPRKMAQVVTQGFEDALEGKDLDAVIAFYSSDIGQEVVALELSARRVFLDADAEAAAMEAYSVAQDLGSDLIEQVDTLISDSDLIEYNVMGALNSNLMFFRGLVDGGAFEMSEEDMLADVWAQESEIRATSKDWLGAFLLLAYRPLDADALEAYAEFYRSPEGRMFNAAIFEAYDQMYEELSYLLGQAVADQMSGEEL